MSTGLWLFFAAAWLAFLLPLVWQRIRARDEGWRPWDIVLSGEMEGRYDYLREVFEGNAELVDALLGDAPAPGGVERTRESTDWGLTALDGFVATARERLVEWQELARVVAAEVPSTPSPLRGQRFRLPALRRLMGLAALRPAVLGFGRSTLGQRLSLLEHGFRLVGNAGAALSARLMSEAWARVRSHSVCLAHDFAVLSREALTSARALLAALEPSSTQGIAEQLDR